MTSKRPKLLDLFCGAGTGTTGKVARDLGRHYLLNDLNPDYVHLVRVGLQAPYIPLVYDTGEIQLNLFEAG